MQHSIVVISPGFGGRVLGSSPDSSASYGVTIRASYFLSLDPWVPTGKMEQRVTVRGRAVICAERVSQPCTIDIWGQLFLVVAAALYTVGCLVVSLFLPHEMPGVTPNPVVTSKSVSKYTSLYIKEV